MNVAQRPGPRPVDRRRPGLDELHLELADLTLTVRREGATGWTAEHHVLRAPILEHGAEPPTPTEPERPRAAVPEQYPDAVADQVGAVEQRWQPRSSHTRLVTAVAPQAC